MAVTYKYTNYLLRNWNKFTRRMDGTTRPHLKALYAGLKELDPMEYKILHQKYLSSSSVASDKELAKFHNVTPTQMASRVTKARTKLQGIIIKQAKEQDNDKQNHEGII